MGIGVCSDVEAVSDSQEVCRGKARAESAAALRRAEAVAEAYNGSDDSQVKFGMWMGIAESWRHLSAG